MGWEAEQMTITLGSLTLTVDYNGIIPRYFKRTAKHSILNAINSKRQNIGRDSHQYEIRGIMEGADRDTDEATLRNIYLDNDQVSFEGYTDSAVNVRVIEFTEIDLVTYWEYTILVEETGT